MTIYDFGYVVAGLTIGFVFGFAVSLCVTYWKSPEYLEKSKADRSDRLAWLKWMAEDGGRE